MRCLCKASSSYFAIFEHVHGITAGTYFASICCNRYGFNPGINFMHKEAGHIVETPVEARAGFLDRPTLVVLIVSTSLTIGLFALLYIGFFTR